MNRFNDFYIPEIKIFTLSSIEFIKYIISLKENIIHIMIFC